MTYFKNLDELFDEGPICVENDPPLFRPGEFLTNVTSNFHFFDGEFHISADSSALIDKSSDDASVPNQQLNSTKKRISPLILLAQLKNRQIGFQFLTANEINLFLTPIMSSMSESYVNVDDENLMPHFSRLIISQTVNVFRSCTLKWDDHSYPPCLLISTLFIRPLSTNPNIFTIYNVYPLPISTNGYSYMYTNIPITIGLNLNEQRIITWDNEKERSQCTFTTIVQCVEDYLSVSLLRTSCLGQLLLQNGSDITACEIKRTRDIGPSVKHVVQNI